ncbi:MAG TPA: serine/threonine-protein kinase [Myxococcales bacterium]|jgi:serine/threonine protein kinase
MAAQGTKAFGEYVLLERIGGGGMSELWRARPKSGPASVVAIKRILSDQAGDPQMLAMFLNEARIAAQLAHPNVAQIFDLGRVGDEPYLAMEYIAGVDLRAIYLRAVERKALMPIPLVAYVGMQLCDALDYAHRKADASGKALGIVHRDVSPDNCIVTFEGQAKLIDFGVAKMTGQGGVTLAGVLKGKLAYMSPEHVLGEPVDRRADVFSLAVLLHELVTGRRLFWAESQIQTLHAVCTREVLPPRKINPHVPVELDALITRALARHKEQRYAWASEMGAALRRFIRGLRYRPTADQLRRYLEVTFPDRLARERDRRTAWALEHDRRRRPERGDALEGDDASLAPTMLDPGRQSAAPSPAVVPDDPGVVLPNGVWPAMEVPGELLTAPQALPPPLPSPMVAARPTGPLPRQPWSVSIDVEGSWWAPSTAAQAFTGIVDLLNESEATLRTRVQLRPGVAIELEIPVSADVKVGVVGTVRWYKPVGDGESALRVVFEDPRPELALTYGRK